MKKTVKIFVISLLSVLCAATLLFVGCGGTEIIDNRTAIISETEISVAIGEEKTLTARLSSGKDVFTWSSSDETVAVVENGKVTGISLGTAEITAECRGRKAVCRVTVTLKDGYPAFANPAQKQELFAGETCKIDGSVYFGGEIVNAELSFRSEDESIATVNSEGVVTGVKKGKTAVTVVANYEGLKTSLVVPVIIRDSVIAEVESEDITLQLVKDEAAGYYTDKTLGIRAISDFADVTDKITDVKWSVSDGSVCKAEAVAEVSGEKRAKVTALKAGEATVTCSFTYGGKNFSQEFGVTVEKALYEGGTAVAYDLAEGGENLLAVVAELPAACKVTSGLSVTVGEEKVSFVKEISGGVACKAVAEEEKGAKTIVLSDEKWEFTFNSGYYCTGVLTQNSHKVLQAGGVISAGEVYVMLEDINVNYSSKDDAIMIYGTLDGLGHTISGITISVEPESGWSTDPLDKDHTYSAYVAENNGTIKNVRFDFTSEKLQESQTSAVFVTVVHINRGVIENVVTCGDFKTDAYRVSALVGKHYGTVKNCVTLIPSSETNFRHRIAGIAIFMYGGIVSDSYSCGPNFNGDETDAEGGNKCYLEKYNGGANVLSWKGLEDASEITDYENFSSANGWSEYWVKTAYGFTFGGRDLSFDSREYFSADYAEEDNGEIVIRVPATVSVTGEVKVYFGNTEAEFVSAENGELRVKKGKIAYGTYNVIIETSAGKYEAKNVRFVTKALTQADVPNFKAIINANPEGYFLLTEDLDFGNEMTEGVIELYGTLDGNGYSLKNLLIKFDARGADWESYLFSKNAGTIKDLGVYCSMYMNGSKSSFIYKNEGTVSNVYMEMTYLFSANLWGSAPLIRENNGLAENCVIVITAAEGVAIGNEVAPIVGTNGEKGEVNDCYAVTNGLTTVTSFCNSNSGSASGNAVFEKLNELVKAATFDSEEGWSEFWTIEGTKIIFGRYE